MRYNSHKRCMNYPKIFIVTTMGPRCSNGEPLLLFNSERQLFVDILNGIRRSLSKDEVVLGKNGIRLPRALTMNKLFWDDELETFAQVWANQCKLGRDYCRSSDDFHDVGQTFHMVRFSYPNWTVPGVKFVYKVPEMTIEKRKFVIEEFARVIFNSKNDVTHSMITNHVGSGEANAFLLAVYGISRRVGCGMSTWQDYVIEAENGPVIYNAVFVVCNFSSQPYENEYVYNTDINARDFSRCGCPAIVKEVDCLCVQYDDPIDQFEAPPWPPIPEVKEDDSKRHSLEDSSSSSEHSKEKIYGGRCKGGRCHPPVVLMPIFTVEDGNVNQPLRGIQATLDRKNQDLRRKIKNKVEQVRDQYFKNYVVLEPKTGAVNKGPFDEDTFVLSKYRPKQKPTTNNKEINYKYPKKKELHKEIKPRKDFSKLDELVSEYLLYKSNSNPNVKQFGDMRQSTTDKVYEAIVKGTVNAIENSEIIRNRDLRIGEPTFNYDEQKYKRHFNNGNNRTSSSLYPDLKPKYSIYNRNSNNMIQKNMPLTEKGNTNRLSNLRSTKSKRKGDLEFSIHPLEMASYYNVYTSNVGDEKDPNEVQINHLLTRNLNPLRSHAYRGRNLNSYKHFETDVDHDVSYVKPRSMVMNFNNNNGHFYDDDQHFGKTSYRRGSNRSTISNVNQIKHYYLDKFSHRRPYTHYDERPRQYPPRENTEQINQEERYIMPDRINRRHRF